jgi:iron(III) transport system permease protein
LKSTIWSKPKLFVRGSKGASLPFLIVGIIVSFAMVLPLIYLGLRASEAGVGILNILASYRTIEVFANSAVLALVVTALSAVIAVAAAFLTVKTDLPWKKFWSVMFVLPLAIPSFVGSFALIATFAPRGSVLQNLLAPLGVEVLPSIYGWPGAIMALTLFTYPYIFLTARTSLRGMDPAIEEVSRSLGHNIRSTIRHVTLPHLYPSIAAGSLLVAFYVLSDFGTPALMRFDSFTRIIYVEYQLAFDRSSAAILSLLLVALVGLILYFEHRVRGRATYYSLGPGTKRQPTIISLGRWKLVALAFCILIVTLAIFVPVGVLLYWFLQGVAVGETPPNIGLVTLNTLYVAVLATLVIAALALPMALLVVRFPNKSTSLIEKISYLGFAMPGIVVALALVSFGAKHLPVLYQSMPMLIFAYMVLFIPLSIGTIRSSLLQISPKVEEAARSLGMSAGRTMMTVTIPMAKTGLLAGAALVILTIMKELPATLLLSPIGFKTLATQVWTGAETASFAYAAAPALILVGISALSVTIILSQERDSARR